jgi:hypothetical protein
VTATLPVGEVAYPLGLPDEGRGDYRRPHAAADGIDLEVIEDWSGRPSVPLDQAAVLVAAAETRQLSTRRAKAERQRDADAVRHIVEAKVAAAARQAFDDSLDVEMRAGRLATAELRAWNSVHTALETQAALAEAETKVRLPSAASLALQAVVGA